MSRLSGLSYVSSIMGRAFAWLCIVAIAVLSLMPVANIQRSDVGGHGEHVIAYAGTAAVVAFAYRGLGPLRVSAMLIAYAACLELLQHFAPGRTPNVSDFLYSSTGVALGIAVFLAGRSVLAVLAARFGWDVAAASRADTHSAGDR